MKYEPELRLNTSKTCAQMSELKKLIRPTTRAVVVNFPHNPSGALLSLADWEALVGQCRAVGAYLFSDEMYRCGR
jgi:aspartate/methionine/tyrosine aminotransferase